MLLITQKKKEKAEITLSLSNEYENTLVILIIKVERKNNADNIKNFLYYIRRGFCLFCSFLNLDILSTIFYIMLMRKNFHFGLLINCAINFIIKIKKL